MGKAAELYKYNEETVHHLWKLQQDIVQYIVEMIPQSYFTLDNCVKKVPNIVSVAFKGVPGGDLQEMLSSIHDVYVGTGSACNSNHHEISQTIKDSKLTEDLYESVIRISTSDLTTEDEILTAMPLIKKCVEQIRATRGV